MDCGVMEKDHVAVVFSLVQSDGNIGGEERVRLER